MYKQSKSLVIFLFSLLLIAACGQKGPLFLPGDTNQISTSMPAQQPLPVEQAEEDKDDDEDDPVTRLN
jgi:predicted small lipoprotein YifL